MPDVFSPTIPDPLLADIRPAGAARLRVKVGTDAAFYNLGAPRDVKLNGKTLQKGDALLRPLGWGIRNELEVPTLQASATEIKILDQLILKPLVAFEIQQLDSIYIKDTAGLATLRWTLESGGDFDDFRLIRYLFAGNIVPTEFAAFFSTSAQTPGTPDAGDALFTLTQTNVAANQKPNGLQKLEFKASGDAAYGEMDFREAKYKFEALGTDGAGGRGLLRNFFIKFTLDAKLLQSTLVETALFGAMITNFIDLKMTHVDGMIITLPNTNVTMVPSFVNDGNVDKPRTIDVHAEGAFTVNSTGTQYQDTGGNNWDTFFS